MVKKNHHSKLWLPTSLVLAILVTLVPAKAAASSMIWGGKSIPVIYIEESDDVPSFSLDTFLQNAVVVHFPVGSAIIPNNDKGFCQLVKAVKQLNDEYVVSRMLVARGSASPDGNERTNGRLSHLRARAIAKTLSKYIALPDSCIDEQYALEDYECLRWLLQSERDKNLPHRSQIINLIDKHQGNAQETKRALQQLDGGKAWKMLLRHYFPELRASRVLLYVSKKGDKTNTPQGVPSQTGNDNTPLGVPSDLQSDGKQRTSENVAALDSSECIRDSLQKSSEANIPLGVPADLQSAGNQRTSSERASLNVKTNVLYDLAMFIPQYGWAPTPNLSLEYLPSSGHITPVAEIIWSPWRSDSRNKTWIVHNILLEGRYYWDASAFTGHYFSAYANMGAYDIQFSKSKGWLSDKWSKNYGLGLGWGYVKRFSPSSRWKWEANAAFGYLHSRYDGYHAAEDWAENGNTYFDWHDNPADYRRYKSVLNYWGITRLGISVSCDLL